MKKPLLRPFGPAVAPHLGGLNRPAAIGISLDCREPPNLGRVADASLRRLACHKSPRYPNSAHIRVGFMPRRLPANSGRVQGRLCRLRQLSGSSTILEVPCRSSASCAIKPATAKTENVGIVAAPCCRPQTRAHLDALRNTSVRDAMVAKILSKMSLLLVGSATTGATEEKCHRHRKTTKSLCAIGFPKGDGSFRFGSGARIWGDLISVIGRW